MMILQFLGPVEERPDLVLIQADDRYFRISAPVWEVLEGLPALRDGTRNRSEMLGAARNQVERSLAPPTVIDGAVSLLDRLGVPRGAARIDKIRARMEIDVSWLVGRIGRLAAGLRLPGWFWFFAAATLAANIVFLHFATRPLSYSLSFHLLGPVYFTAAAALLLAIFFCHELAHCVAAVVLGCRAHRVGVGVFMVFPVFYADVSDVWRLAPRKRLIVNAAGLIFQGIVGLALIAMSQTFSGPLGQMAAFVAVINATTISVNILPFAKLDGYWMVADALNVADLRGETRWRIRAPVEAIRRAARPGALEDRWLCLYVALRLALYAAIAVYGTRALILVGTALYRGQVNVAALAGHVFASPVTWVIGLYLIIQLAEAISSKSRRKSVQVGVEI